MQEILKTTLIVLFFRNIWYNIRRNLRNYNKKEFKQILKFYTIICIRTYDGNNMFWFNTRSNGYKWDDDFHNNRCINILDLISKEDMKTIRKLNIEVEEKIYTKYELEVLYLNLLEYYDDDIDEKELELLKPLGIIKNLDETEVSREEYNELLEKVYPYNIII